MASASYRIAFSSVCTNNHDVASIKLNSTPLIPTTSMIPRGLPLRMHASTAQSQVRSPVKTPLGLAARLHKTDVSTWHDLTPSTNTSERWSLARTHTPSSRMLMNSETRVLLLLDAFAAEMTALAMGSSAGVVAAPLPLSRGSALVLSPRACSPGLVLPSSSVIDNKTQWRNQDSVVTRSRHQHHSTLHGSWKIRSEDGTYRPSRCQHWTWSWSGAASTRCFPRRLMAVAPCRQQLPVDA